MSRAYDAKQHALNAHSDSKEDAVDLFLDFLDISEDDFKYEFNQTAKEYIFGKCETPKEKTVLCLDCNKQIEHSAAPLHDC